MESYPNMIAGRLVNTPQQDEVINPALGKPFATCARGTSEQLNEAVSAAAETFKTWRKDESLRRQKLNECAAAIQARVQDIAGLLVQEQGKPMTAAIGEVFGASMWFSYFANLQIDRFQGSAAPAHSAAAAILLSDGHGYEVTNSRSTNPQAPLVEAVNASAE